MRLLQRVELQLLRRLWRVRRLRLLLRVGLQLLRPLWRVRRLRLLLRVGLQLLRQLPSVRRLRLLPRVELQLWLRLRLLLRRGVWLLPLQLLLLWWRLRRLGANAAVRKRTGVHALYAQSRVAANHVRRARKGKPGAEQKAVVYWTAAHVLEELRKPCAKTRHVSL